MKAKIHAIAVIAAATMILTGCATHQQRAAHSRTIRARRRAVQHLPAQRRHRQGRIGRYLTISRSGQKEQ